MKKLTLVFDSIDMYSQNNQKEYNDYISSINGVVETNISYNIDYGTMTFDITYDEKVINNNVLYLELKTILNIYKYPSLIFFDKHFDGKTDKIEVKKRLCCEYCFKIDLEDMFEMDGIIKVENNFIERYIEDNCDIDDKEDILTIYYDKKLIDKNTLDKIIESL